MGKGIANLLVEQLADAGALGCSSGSGGSEVAREGEAATNVKARDLVLGTVTRFGGEQPPEQGGLAGESADFQATTLGEATLSAVRDTAAKLHPLLVRMTVTAN